MISPHRLAALRAVIESGSVNRAAANLSYSPATISQHLSALARETGLVLFERHGRGIVATPAAHQLAEHAGAVLADLGRLDRLAADLRTGQTEYLAIACFASAAHEWIPQVVRELRRERPGLTVDVTLNEPMDGRGRRRPDLDIRTEPADGVERCLDGYRRLDLVTERLVAVLPAEHPLAGADHLALRDLRDQPWIDHAIYDSPIRAIIENACSVAGYTPSYAARLDDDRAALRLVALGVGVIVLPLLAAVSLDDGLVAVPLTHPIVERRVVVHVRDDARRTALIAQAVEHLRAVVPPRP